MQPSHWAKIAVPAVVLLMTACSMPNPYVYLLEEFNRDAVGFGKKPTDIDDVSICYSSWSTTPDVVSKLAQAECGKYDKDAVPQHQDYQYCALMTPRRAVYACRKR